MTPVGTDLTDGTTSNLWRRRIDGDAKEKSPRSRIRRAWHYLVDRPLV
jgi:hypothetical protein